MADLTEYTYTELITGLLDKTIPLATGNIAQITRNEYYDPYKNYTNFPFPVAYVNITPNNLNINLSNSETNNTSFAPTDFITPTDWILLNGSDSS